MGAGLGGSARRLFPGTDAVYYMVTALLASAETEGLIGEPSGAIITDIIKASSDHLPGPATI